MEEEKTESLVIQELVAESEKMRKESDESSLYRPINIAEGISKMNNDEILYFNMLQNFSGMTLDPLLVELKNGMEDNDLEKLQICLRRLSKICANYGMAHLPSICKDMLKSIADELSKRSKESEKEEDSKDDIGDIGEKKEMNGIDKLYGNLIRECIGVKKYVQEVMVQYVDDDYQEYDPSTQFVPLANHFQIKHKLNQFIIIKK